MEQINKLLILLVGLAIGAIVYVVVIEAKSTKNIAKISENISENIAKITEDKNITVPKQAPHPYNECIKLLIDQANKENKQSDFDKMKAVCFVLADQEKN